jgi:HEPN domain-containing protein
MSEARDDVADPRAWLARARSCLARARVGYGNPDIFLEDLAFDTQQSVEKALKALLIHQDIAFPRTHDLHELITLAHDAGLAIPGPVLAAARLTPYAVRVRYPGGPRVTEDDYRAALKTAEEVLI